MNYTSVIYNIVSKCLSSRRATFRGAFNQSTGQVNAIFPQQRGENKTSPFHFVAHQVNQFIGGRGKISV